MPGEGSVLVNEEEAREFTDLIVWLPKKTLESILFSGSVGRRKVTL